VNELKESRGVSSDFRDACLGIEVLTLRFKDVSSQRRGKVVCLSGMNPAGL
jgi:hypothetical protein